MPEWTGFPSMERHTVDEFTTEYWRPELLGFASFVLTLVVLPDFFSSQPRMDPDTLLFNYIGWLTAQGGIPYVDVWDVKPPMVPHLTAGLATLSGGNMRVLALLSILASAGVVLGTVLLAGELVHEHTENPLAALASGLGVFAYPAMYLAAGNGIRPKYFTLFFGLLAVYLLLQERYFFAGVAGAVSAGFWQFGLIFVLLPVVYPIWAGDRRATARAMAGIVATTIVMLAPFAIRGALWPVIIEVVVSPFLAPESQSFISRWFRVERHLGLLFPLFLLSIPATVYYAIDDKRSVWALAGLLWFAMHVLVFDFDSGMDLLPLLTFAAIAIGLLTDVVDDPDTTISGGTLVLAFVVVIVAIGLPWFAGGSVYPVKAPESGPGTLSDAYWNQTVVSDCHERMSGMEEVYVEKVGEHEAGNRCGDVPADVIIKEIIQ